MSQQPSILPPGQLRVERVVLGAGVTTFHVTHVSTGRRFHVERRGEHPPVPETGDDLTLNLMTDKVMSADD